MIVDGDNGDTVDISLILQRAIRVVEMQARTIETFQTQLSKFFDREPPGLAGYIRPKGELFSIELSVLLPLELYLTTHELWFGQEQEGILPELFCSSGIV